MIYTVTFNPSLDYIVSMNDFQLGKTNRTTEELILPGGKGLNVSTVLHNLGIENTALGFTAGFVGEEIKRLASAVGYGYDFFDVQNGTSRINVKLKDFDGKEINGMGPEIDGNALNALMEKLRMLKEGDTLILAGSIPACMPKSIYSDILKVLDGKGIDFVVDATKELLLNVLQYHPFLIKPNNHELGELFGVKLEKKEQIEPYARKLQELGARNVLVSMAGEGAVLLDESGNLHQLDAPKGKLVNAVGAGDSMVAGFLAGWIEQKDYLHAFKMAVCAGSASAFSEGYAKKEEIETLYRDL